MEKQVALTTCRGHVVAAEIAADGWVLRGNRSRVFGWEVLTLVAAGDGAVALRTCHGFYVAALPAEGDWLLCGNRLRVREWERFIPIEVGRYVALRTAHGRFVSAEPAEDGWVLRADRTTIGAPERFGGGEVEPAPLDGAAAEAFAPFEAGAFVWRGPFASAVRALVRPTDGAAVEETAAPDHRQRPEPGRAYGGPIRTAGGPIRTACGTLWL